MPDSHKIRVKINGVLEERTVEPRRLLVDFLRHDLHLTGTHVGCEHGVCGACTILLNGETVRSCLLFAVQADGAEITTVEGLTPNNELTALQKAFWERHGLQCGFCTPGFLMAAQECLVTNVPRNRQEIREALSGNLCRCTGYQSIVDAVAEVVASKRKGG